MFFSRFLHVVFSRSFLAEEAEGGEGGQRGTRVEGVGWEQGCEEQGARSARGTARWLGLNSHNQRWGIRCGERHGRERAGEDAS